MGVAGVSPANKYKMKMKIKFDQSRCRGVRVKY